MVIKKYSAIMIFIILLGIAFASFDEGSKSHEIKKIYDTESKIKGWINISLDNEPADSMLADSLGNSIKLKQLLDSQKIIYSCDSEDCLSTYSSSNGEATKSFALADDAIKTVGIVFNKEMISIDSATFSVESDAGPSCRNQIRVDVLGDSTVDGSNKKSSGASCSEEKNTGCFSEGGTLSEGNLDMVPYCQKFLLAESPEIEAGAWVKKDADAPSETIKMSIYDSDYAMKKSCNLPDASTEGGEISCVINYSIPELKNYYICISSDGNSGTYKIRGQLKSGGCGYKGVPGTGAENYAYQIFAIGKKFDAVGTFNVTGFAPEISDYIQVKYKGLNCSGGCVVPVKIYSGANQNIILKSLSVKYGIGGGLTETSNLFYDSSEVTAKMTSGFKKIYLDNASFILPSEKKDITYKLNLGGQQIFSEKISIVLPSITIKGLTPTTTANGYPTKFTVSVSSNKNISAYNWDFGDGKTEKTYVNQVIHTYNSTGNYILKISANDSGNSESSKSFNISVASAKSVINSLLSINMENFNHDMSQIKTLDKFYQDSIDSVFNLTESNNAMKEIQRRYSLADSEEDYKEILTDLLKINIPKSIKLQVSAPSLTFYPSEDSINLDVLEEIGGGTYDSQKENNYIQSILRWNQENIETKVSFSDFVAEYEDYEESALKVFEVNIKKNESLSADPYLIIENIENLKFKENYKEEETLGYVYITLEHPEQKIVFSTTEDVDFTDLPIFISPEINRLSLVNAGDYEEANNTFGSKWILFGLIFILIIIIGLVVYVILQEWYKKKYEDKLFPNKNNLYNLVVFIENSKKKGKTDKQISSELKKAGWSPEQTTYALKKHAGKRTGMVEIPVTGIFKKSGENHPQ